MSKRNKLQKFAEILNFPNVLENLDPAVPVLTRNQSEQVVLNGRWNKDQFDNNHPITLELACGRGEYTLGLAQMYPQRNFIGVDVKGARIWRGAKNALDHQLSNVAFLRTRIEQIHLFFEPGEISEIWITFPDPFLKNSKTNRRLTSHRFLSAYRQLLRPGGLAHLKTDSEELYEFSLSSLAEYPGAELLYQNADIYAGELLLPELAIKTYYERMHLAAQKKIKYLQWKLR